MANGHGHHGRLGGLAAACAGRWWALPLGSSLTPRSCPECGEHGLKLDAPAPVATIVTAADLDDRDWWHATHVDVDEPTSVEFSGLTFPATVFVDGTEVARCESMFLPVRIELEPGRHDVCVRFESPHQLAAYPSAPGSVAVEPGHAAGLRWAPERR